MPSISLEASLFRYSPKESRMEVVSSVMVSWAKSMAASSWAIRSFSRSTSFNASACCLQLARCSSRFSSSHWSFCCFSISSPKPVCWDRTCSIFSVSRATVSSEVRTARLKRLNSAIRTRNASMASSLTVPSPKCREKISCKSFSQ